MIARSRSQLIEEVKVATGNELVTRQRVDAIEEWLAAWSSLTLWRRFRWLLLGR